MGTKSQTIERELMRIVQDLPVGTKMPPERLLVERFGVARETLRRALSKLEQDGHLERRHGVGTFVGSPKLTQYFRLRSFTEDMAAQGMETTSKILHHKVALAGAALSGKLGISPAAEVVTIKRLRLANGEPMAIETVRLPAARVRLLPVDRLAEESLYALLANEYDLSITGGSQTIEATVASAEEARILSVPVLSPMLLVDRITWTRSGERLESTRSLYRGDRYKFSVDLTVAATGTTVDGER
jgi:GntR family transcriptional regulator